MSLPEQFLQAIADPNVAYLLFGIGTIGLIAEMYHPGTWFPGIAGGLSIILAFVAFGSLPLNWAGLLLLLLAAGLVLAELHTPGVSVFGVGAAIAFVLGSLILYTPFGPVSPAAPQVRVSPALVVAVGVLFVVFFGVVLRAVLRVRRSPVRTGPEALVGRLAVTTSALAPTGTVRLGGEDWSARSGDGTIGSGEVVRVVDVHGVILGVTRPPPEPAGRATPASDGQ